VPKINRDILQLSYKKAPDTKDGLYTFYAGSGVCHAIYFKGNLLVMDCGHEAKDNFALWLERRIVNSITFVLSHCDEDHMVGAIAIHNYYTKKSNLIKNFKIYVNTPQAKKSNNRSLKQLNTLSKAASVIDLRSQEEITVQQDFTVQFVNPLHDQPCNNLAEFKGNMNTLSVCSIVRVAGRVLIFTGDATATFIQEKVITKLMPTEKNNIEVFEVPHHGSCHQYTGNIEDFYKTFQAKYYLICGGKLGDSNPHIDTIRSLYSATQIQASFYYTHPVVSLDPTFYSITDLSVTKNQTLLKSLPSLGNRKAIMVEKKASQPVCFF
jgi:beta-lactamase superfamily II metal-dependent hydrolase